MPDIFDKLADDFIETKRGLMGLLRPVERRPHDNAFVDYWRRQQKPEPPKPPQPEPWRPQLPPGAKRMPTGTAPPPTQEFAISRGRPGVPVGGSPLEVVGEAYRQAFVEPAAAAAWALRRGENPNPFAADTVKRYRETVGPFAQLGTEVLADPLNLLGAPGAIRAAKAAPRVLKAGLQAAKPAVRELAASEAGGVGKRAAKGAKEPWQTRKNDFITTQLEIAQSQEKGLTGGQLDLPYVRRQIADMHETLVKDAVREGKPVPSSVLADYPEWAAPTKPKPPAAPAAAKEPVSEGAKIAGFTSEAEYRAFLNEPISSTVVAKPEFWQQTKKSVIEHAKQEIARLKAMRAKGIREAGNSASRRSLATMYGIKIRDAQGRLAAEPKLHEQSVRQALASGKPVPAEVLADYPELAAKAAPAARAEAATQAAAPVAPSTVAPTALPKAARAPAIPKGPFGPQGPFPEPAPIRPGQPAAGGVPPVVPPTTTAAPIDPDDTIRRFARFLASPETENAWDLTVAMRKKALGERIGNFQSRAQQLVVEGKTAEDAMGQALGETMSGKLPGASGGIIEGITDEMRQALFQKVYTTLADEPFEQISTAQALRNALLDQPIPRKPGTAGGSAWQRLTRVFGEDSEVLKVLDQPKKLEDVVSDAVIRSGKDPMPPDQELLDYLRSLPTRPNLSRQLGATPLDLNQPLLPGASKFGPTGGPPPDVPLSVLATEHPDAVAFKLQQLRFADQPRLPVGQFELPIEQAVKQPSLMPLSSQHAIIRTLKEAGRTAVDIGNFIRANKASVDFSFWRQQAPLIVGHAKSFARANVEAWRAMWNPKAAKESWDAIVRDPLYHIYEKIQKRGGGRDFLREPISKTGKPTAGAEEFGYLTENRPIPKFTGKLPHVKVSERAFVTGTNAHNWKIFKKFYEGQLRINERIAQGKQVLKPGEAFDIEKNLTDFAKFLADFSGRGGMGHFAESAPTLSALFFAPRYAMGRLLSPRHLFSTNPYVRSVAWKDATLFAGTMGSILLLGKEIGAWDVELDPRSSDFAKIRVGKIRVDPWGGYQQFARLIAQVVTNTGIATDTGQPYPLDPQQALTRFARGKASPLTSFVADVKSGKTYVGDKVDLADIRQWIERVAPLTPWDIYEAATQQSAKDAALVAIPGALGAGVSTYGLPDWKDDMAPYFAIPSDTVEAKAKRLPTRSDYRKRNPEIEAKLFITGQVTSVSTTAAASHVRRLVAESTIKPETIKGVEKYVAEQEKLKKLGVRDSNITITDRLAQGLIKTGQSSAPSATATPRPTAAPTLSAKKQDAGATWPTIEKSLGSQGIQALVGVWYSGKPLDPRAVPALRATYAQYPMGQPSFYAWYKQTLRQVWENYNK